MADPRNMMTRQAYQVERTALVADALACRSGRYGANGALYLEGNRRAAARVRSVYYHRRNRVNRG